MLTKMKIALVMCGTLLCGVAAAQPAQGSGAGSADRKAEFHKQREAKKAEMLQKFDTNKDGKLDENERTAAHDAMVLERFKKLDTDGNGVLSLAEFKAGKQGHMGGRHARGMHRGHFRGGNRTQGAK